jgi:uncharacterized protein YcbX
MQTIGEVAAIWRYPVKSLMAEPLQNARIEANGIPGDRAAALFVESGHAREGKPYRGKEHNLLHTTSDQSEAVRMAGERSVRVALRSEPRTHYFDAAPISLVFDRWIGEVAEALEMDLHPLRWRPNLFARSAPDFTMGEPDLLGRIIELGDVVLRVCDTIGRCVTTTYDVQTGEPDNDVLLYVAQKRNNVMGVYCEVELAGTVRAGDALRLRAR